MTNIKPEVAIARILPSDFNIPFNTQSLSGCDLSPWIHIAGHLLREIDNKLENKPTDGPQQNKIDQEHQ